jgi:hypothetical protein
MTLRISLMLAVEDAGQAAAWRHTLPPRHVVTVTNCRAPTRRVEHSSAHGCNNWASRRF